MQASSSLFLHLLPLHLLLLPLLHQFEGEVAGEDEAAGAREGEGAFDPSKHNASISSKKNKYKNNNNKKTHPTSMTCYPHPHRPKPHAQHFHIPHIHIATPPLHHTLVGLWVGLWSVGRPAGGPPADRPKIS